MIHDFGDMYGSTSNAYVVPYPYWVDTRLVGMNAGDPTRDYAIPPDQIPSTLNFPQPKMFLVNPADQTDLEPAAPAVSTRQRIQLSIQGW